jgi:hypothetical protein
MSEENRGKGILEQFSRKYLKILEDDVLSTARKSIEKERKNIVEQMEELDKEVPRECYSVDREIMEKRLNLMLKRLNKISNIVENEWKEIFTQVEE